MLELFLVVHSMIFVARAFAASAPIAFRVSPVVFTALTGRAMSKGLALKRHLFGIGWIFHSADQTAKCD